MAAPVLAAPAPGGGRGQEGFTLIETAAAMAIMIVVMLANLFLFSTAAKNYAAAKAFTEATDLANAKIGELKARLLSTCPCFTAGTETCDDGLADFAFSGTGSPCGSGDVNPDYPGLINASFCWPAATVNASYPVPSGSALCESSGTRNPAFTALSWKRGNIGLVNDETLAPHDVLYALTWGVNEVDLDHDGTVDPELQGELVEIRVGVTWAVAGEQHELHMASFAAGRSE